MQKKWYPIFVYEDTLNRMDRDLERDDTLAVNMIVTPQVSQINKPVSFIAQSQNAEFFEWNF